MNDKETKWNDIFKLPGYTYVELVEKILKKRNLLHDKDKVNKTNSGSQLVDMLEDFDNNSYLEVEDYDENGNRLFMTYHNDYDYDSQMVEGRDNYSLYYIDWLHEKNKRTYHGLLLRTEDYNHSLDYFNFELEQSKKGIKVYG